MIAAQDVSRAQREFDRAASAARQPQADLAEARQQLAHRTAALEAAKDERRRAEDAYDAEPSNETYAAFVDTGNRVTAKEFLVSRTRERVAKLQPVANAADAAKTAAERALRIAEAADAEAEPVKLVPSFDRAWAERQAALGNETAKRMLGVEERPIINGAVASPLDVLATKVKSALGLTKPAAPDAAVVARARDVIAGIRPGDLFQAEETLRGAGVSEAEIARRGLHVQSLADR